MDTAVTVGIAIRPRASIRRDIEQLLDAAPRREQSSIIECRSVKVVHLVIESCSLEGILDVDALGVNHLVSYCRFQCFDPVKPYEDTVQCLLGPLRAIDLLQQ